MSSAPTPAWRTFSFFNAQAVHDRLEPGQAPPAFKNSNEISTICAGQGLVVVADIHGQVHVCNADLDTTKTFVAHADNGRVTHAKFAGAKGVLVTLGEEETSPHPVLKIWNVRSNDKATGQPRLLASGRIAHGTRSHPVSTLAVTANLSLIAIGMADGTVLLLRQVDQYLQSAASSAGPASLPKPKVVHSSPSDPITGLGFRTKSSSSTLFTNTITGSSAQPSESAEGDGNVTLFIVTTHQILTYTTTSTGKGISGSSARATVLDDVGASLNCSTMLPGGELVLAKEEAILVYTPEGRGQSYFYEGAKSAISTYLNYLIITSPPFLPTASSQSATVRNFVRDQRTSTSAGPGPLDTSTDISKVTIFDPENRFVAYSGAFPEGVREVFCEWGDVFVLANDSKLARLVERATQDKLNMLFSKSLFLQAVSLARQSGLDESDVAEIYRRYGDHLYEKGDYDGAMAQFIKTIGKVPPSSVIRKFLDGQRINNLTSYLQEVHSQNLANSDITTLLLNCYAKLKDTARLDSFITSASVSATGELPFDLETAIRVCRQAGYYDHAVFLAKTYDQPEEYLRIQIEDREEWADAVSYIRTLGQQVAEVSLRRYGKTLLASLPEETTELFVDLCCGTLDRVSAQPALMASSEQVKDAPSKASYLSYLALSSRSGPAPSAAKDRPSTPNTSTAVASTARDRTGPPNVTVTEANPARPTSTAVEDEQGLPAQSLPREPLPKVRQFFAHYIDQSRYFIEFLETVAEKRWADKSRHASEQEEEHDRERDQEENEEKEAIWNTLVEVYLSEAASGSVSIERRRELEQKALDLMQNHEARNIPLDLTQALLVCTTAEFVPGILGIYDKMSMYEEIVRFWMDRSLSESASSAERDEATKEVMAALEKYGLNNHELYPLVLRYLTSSAALLSKHQDDLLSILEYIDAEKIMPPIAVIQALSKSGVTSVGMVKEYLRRQITGEQAETEADRALAASYRTDLEKKEREIAELADPHAPRVFQVTRCSACGGTLDLPAVHFMCRHSYHQRCLADNEGSCPICAAAHGVVQEIKAANDQLVGRHDLFMQEVEDADDRFESVVNAFSRGLVRIGDE